MSQKLPTILFAGPTLNAKSRLLAENAALDLKPPVERGQIARLNQANFKGNIIIVDGYFKQNLAIGHAEIREAIDRGCAVYGLCSMGAIRAYEMQICGMHGYGKVYEWFLAEQDFQDDEVALLHSEGPQYIPVSEPLVHIRECVKHLIANDSLKEEEGREVVASMKKLYYGERNKPLFFKLLANYPTVDINWVETNFNQFRIKQLDLENFLLKKVWQIK